MTSDPSTQTAADSKELMGGEPILINAEELARLLSVSQRTLRRLVVIECLPEPVPLLTRPRWRVDEIREWVDAGCPARLRWVQLRNPKYNHQLSSGVERSGARRKRNSTHHARLGASPSEARA
jgi:predicted DNA-binding transcriptional regulator AlpA